ncbi:MAG: hypothetical protein N2316_11450 [Spirochaetes bacterium]|nr:hypothetical protein [Spirochaetota bacterium]
MSVKILLRVVSVFMVFCIYPAFAQEVKAPSDAPKDEPLKVSGRMYIEWVKTLENEYDSGENYTSFNLKRVYLDFQRKLDAIWSIRATIDVENNKVSRDGKDDTRYVDYMKFAFLQALVDLGFGTLRTQFGLIGTPVIELIDGQSDYRWINQNYIDAAKAVFFTQALSNTYASDAKFIESFSGSKGQSIDSSADMGVSIALSVEKMVTVTVAAVHGEGYKNTKEDPSATTSDDGKAFYGMITLTPVDGLSVAGFMRYQILRDNGENADDNFSRYYGGTILYNFQGIRVGASYVLATVSTCGTTVGEEAKVAEYNLLDVFLLANLNAFTGMPILLAGRFATGTTKYEEGYGNITITGIGTYDFNGKKAKRTVWAVGMGYQFNNYVRFMAYLEDQSSSGDVEWDGSNRTFYIKSEAKF